MLGYILAHVGAYRHIMGAYWCLGHIGLYWASWAILSSMQVSFAVSSVISWAIFWTISWGHILGHTLGHILDHILGPYLGPYLGSYCGQCLATLGSIWDSVLPPRAVSGTVSCHLGQYLGQCLYIRSAVIAGAAGVAEVAVWLE